MSLDPNIAFGMALFASVPIYLIVQICFAWAWRGGWRIAALGPLIVTLPAFAWTAQGAWHGGNLAAIPMLFAAAPSLVYLIIVWIVRLVARKAAA
jgi:hypothetical protein